MHNPFRYFNSSPEVIRSTVMLYVRFPLSLRPVEDLHLRTGHRRFLRNGAALVEPLWPVVFFAEIRKTHGSSWIAIRQTGAGILMRCLSGSTVRHIIYGGPLTMKAKCLRSMSRNGGVTGLRLSFLEQCNEALWPAEPRSSRTDFVHTAPR